MIGEEGMNCHIGVLQELLPEQKFKADDGS
jgi:hypothetical protein